MNYRLFVCLELPSADREALGAMQGRLRKEGARVSWVSPGNIHLTLVFLGDIDEGRVSTIAGALDRAVDGVGSFEIRLGGTGGFPSLNRPRVLWVGVDGALERLRSLRARVARELSAVGCSGDSKPFSPHLTIGRVRDDRDPALRRVTSSLAAEQITFDSFSVSEVILMRSELGPQGSRYTPLHRARLAIP